MNPGVIHRETPASHPSRLGPPRARLRLVVINSAYAMIAVHNDRVAGNLK